MAPLLPIVIGSTRPGRIGPSVAKWFHELALKHEKFDVALVDLLEVNLPILNEPEHPRLKKYQFEHTKKWSASVDAADAFVFVTPEYNHGPTPALLNAWNYLFNEWNYKPAAFVSYGGQSGGLRSVQAGKLTLVAMKMVPIVEAVAIPFVSQHLDAGRFTPNEGHIKSAEALLDELFKWSAALKGLRK